MIDTPLGDIPPAVYSISFATGFIAVHLVALYATHWWTSTWYGGVKDLILSGWASDPNRSASEAFFDNMFLLMWLVMAIIMGIGSGVVATCFILASLGRLLIPWLINVARACLRLMKRISGRTQDDFDEETTLLGVTDFGRAINWLGSVNWPSLQLSTAHSEAWRTVGRICKKIDILATCGSLLKTPFALQYPSSQLRSSTPLRTA